MKKAVGPIIVCASLALSGTMASADSKHTSHSHRSFETGEPGDPAKPARVIDVTMRETPEAQMQFVPDRIEVKLGEQIRFAIKNVGTTDHEFMLDSIARNARHKIAMEKNPDMEHDDPNGKRLAAGKSSEIIWRFTKRGTFEFACLIPGHYESGMHGAIVVK